jgi:hypothetical protein
LVRLDADLAGLNDAYGSFGGNDVYFFGDVAMWKKFANTLKVRIGITLGDADEALGRAAVESAYMGAFAEGELCQLQYETGTYSNPLYQDLIQSGRNDFVPANTLVDMMNTLNDPRRPKYMEINGEEYRGGQYGYSSAFASFSHIADPIQEPDYPMTILDYTELAFYLAEAAARGWSVGGTAADWYNKGIMASMDHWGVDAADAADYMAQESVAYNTAAGDWKQKIATQEWLAFYVRGFEAWNLYRRLDWPVMNVPQIPETTDGKVPRRFKYPVNEQTLNAESYQAAKAAMGDDVMEIKLFWDKY